MNLLFFVQLIIYYLLSAVSACSRRWFAPSGDRATSSCMISGAAVDAQRRSRSGRWCLSQPLNRSQLQLQQASAHEFGGSCSVRRPRPPRAWFAVLVGSDAALRKARDAAMSVAWRARVKQMFWNCPMVWPKAWRFLHVGRWRRGRPGLRRDSLRR